MEALFIGAVVVVLVTPIAALVALLRSAGLRKEVEHLRREVSHLRRAVTSLRDRPDGAEESAPREQSRAPDDQHQHSPAAAPTTRAGVADEALPAAFRTSGAAKDQAEESTAETTHEAPSSADPAFSAPASDPHTAAEPAPSAPEDEPAAREQEPAGAGRSPNGGSASALDLETRLGTTWILRIGLGILAIALALFARNVVPQLSPAAKVATAYAGSALFFGIGRFFAHRLQRFARPVMAGGLAFGFFVAYAAYFVPGMRAVPMAVSIAWMAVSMATVLVAAESWRSQSTAALAILLGHISAYVSAGQADLFSLVMIGFLTVTGAVLLLRHRWVPLGLSALAAAYGSHFLWIVAERAPIDGDVGFWINVGFLSSYYVVFLIADVLWWRRREDASPDGALGASAERGRRGLGPINLVLYVALTSFVYFVGDARVETIEVFFFALGSLQGGLAWWYHRTHHRDFIFYPAFGSILWTLGFFAWMDALVLNLVLAAQALLLLMAAHRTRLWIFHALAQAMLAVAFVHYWSYPVGEAAWPVFLGGLGLVAVYWTKSLLEEVWYGPDELDAEVSSEAASSVAGLRAFTNAFRGVAPFLPPLHAMLGSSVLVREAQAFWSGDSGVVGTLVVAQILILAIVAVRRKTGLLFAIIGLAASGSVFVPALADSVAAGWFLVSLGLSAVSLSVLGDSFPATMVRNARHHAQAVLVLTLIPAFARLSAMERGDAAVIPWLLLPLALFASQELLRSARAGDGGSASETAPGTPASPLDAVMNVVVAMLTVGVVATSFGLVPLAPVLTSVGALALFGLAAARNSQPLGAGAYTLLLLGEVTFLLIEDQLARATFESWWAGPIVMAVPLLIALGLDRKIPPSRAARSAVGADGVGTTAGDVLVWAPYAAGFILVAAVAHTWLPLGWSLAMPATLATVLLMGQERLQTSRLPSVVIVDLLMLNLLFMALVLRGSPASGALWGVLTLGVASAAAERLATRPGTDGDEPVASGEDALMLVRLAPLLVGVAAAATMTAIYESAIFGAQWATAGWSVMAGLLMVSGFGLKAASHRRVGLLVLAVCLVRVFVVDTQGLSETARIGAFFVLGICLVGVALLYARYARQLKEWL